MPERTLPRLFEDSVRQYPDRILIWEKKEDRYEGTSYSRMRTRVHEFAAGLMRLGLKKGDRVALIAEGRNDWIMSELGILFAGAVNVPVSVKIEELADLKFRLSHSGCRMAVVSRSQLGKIRRIKNDLADLEKIVLLDREPCSEPDEVFADDVRDQGRKALSENPEGFESVWQSVGENDPANICYTSGTTADPKGIILTHRNYTSNVEQAQSLVPFPPHYVSLIILPWDHAFAHTCGIYTVMKGGAALASIQPGKTLLETLKNVPVNIREIRPHFLLSVPSLAKSFRRNIEKNIRDKGPAVEALFRKALKAAYQYNGDGWDKGKGLKALQKPLLLFYDKVLFRKIREGFGGRLEFFVGGGALLDIELQRFFYAVGIPMFQGYGLTEAAPVISANSPKFHKLGSSGRVAGAIDLRICDEHGNALPAGETGEIIIRGENVMAGYWKNEKASGETIRAGWLYTGDLGYLDADGFLYVKGRMKSLLIANDGEKYSPEEIEEAIAENSPYVDQVMLYNDQSPFTVALVVPNKEAVLRRLQELGLSCRTPEGQDAALKLIEDAIADFREGGRFPSLFPPRWLPSAVGVLGEGFTEQNGFLNSTLKMVRGRIAEFYRSRIDGLFLPEARNIRNPQNLNIVSRFE
ncbi:MAG: AMP-dependent synthetase/ligase [Candidatus Aminicenantales bacterium]